MEQVARIIDPNYLSYRRNMFKEHGRKLISIMRAKGVDKKTRDAMRVFLAKQDEVLRKFPSMHNEMTRYGSPLVTSAFQSDVLGIYNPDTIPIDTYLKMKTDPQVAIGLAMIKMPLYSLGWNVECEDVDIREFVRAALKPIWTKLIKSMLTAVDFGFASHEKVWVLKPMNVVTKTPRLKTHFKGKAEVYKKIKVHYPSTIRIRTDRQTDEFLGIVQQAGMGGQLISLDAEKCFLFALQDEFGNYFGRSRLKPAYKSWYWKEVLTQFMLRYFERRGSPATVVQHPMGGGLDKSGNEYDNSEIALRIGQNIIENSVVTLPFEPDKEGQNQWKIDYLQDERRGEMFVAALNYLGAQILRGLLTPERVMTQDLSTGSFSMASSHAEIFLLSEEGLAEEMEEAINREIVPPLVEFNFKPKKVVKCNIRIEKIQYDRKRILKEILVEIIRNINTMVKAGKAPSLMPSIIEMSNVLGVPLRAFDEEYEDTDMASENQPNKETPPTEPSPPKEKQEFALSTAYALKDIDKEGWLEAYKEGKVHWANDKNPSPLAESLVNNAAAKGAVLEIGCGNGRDSKYLASQGFDVTAIDISPIAIKMAKKLNSHKKIKYQVADAEDLKFDDDSFDYVYSLSVLHSTNMPKSFKEIKRVLKKNGLALIFLYRASIYVSNDGEVKEETNFTDKQLERILKANKLVVLDKYSTESEFEDSDEGKHKHFIVVMLLKNNK